MNTLFKSITIFALGIILITEKAEASSKISLEKAKEIALSHAKLSSKEVNFTETRLDDDFNNAEFEIEFFHQNIEYEYEIDAKSGKINSYSQEKHGVTQKISSSHGQNTNYITKDQAEQIAFKHANVSKVIFSNTEFDIDDGIAVYDVEFFANNTKYEYEINAISSEIIEFEQD